MKRFLVILVGGLTLMGIGMLAVAVLSGWIVEEFIHGDDDMNAVGKILVFGIYPCLFLVGGWLGNIVHRRA